MDRCDVCDKEILESQVKALQELIEVARQVVRELLVQAALEAVLGAVAEHAEGVVGHGGAVLHVAG